MPFQNEVYTDHEGYGEYNAGDHLEPSNTSLYNWVFHYNEFTGLWNAIPRDDYNEYWSNHQCERIISSSSIDTLKELIQRTDGDKKKIESLIGK